MEKKSEFFCEGATKCFEQVPIGTLLRKTQFLKKMPSTLLGRKDVSSCHMGKSSRCIYKGRAALCTRYRRYASRRLVTGQGQPFAPGIDGRLADGLSPGNCWKYDPTSACHRATVGNTTRRLMVEKRRSRPKKVSMIG